MDNEIQSLYNQIKNRTISRAEAAKRMQAIQSRRPQPEIETGWLDEQTARFLKKQLSQVMKLPVDRIEADAPFERYGLDSVMVMQLTDLLEQSFGSLPKTLFFEYQNLEELTGYFLKNHGPQLIEQFGGGQAEAGVAQVESTSARSHTQPQPRIGGRKRSRSRFGTLPGKTAPKSDGPLDIAIIGLAGRYPGALNVHEFWNNLRDGKDSITEIPADRWDHSLYYDEDRAKPGKTYSKWGGFLDGVDQFDPLFFNISPREAEGMDPQERLFLECVYETLEDAGYTRTGLNRNVGVFVGVMFEEYQLYGAQEQIHGNNMAIGGNSSSIANRVSYVCNFHGPSLALNTMCSSSLTAIHLACQSLLRGECETAIAGGVNVSVHPNKYLLLGQGNFVSSKGRCESFGEGGDGYVPGEGVGAVLLKPLEKAVADGDLIYGVIKGSALNHGGKTNGYTVPNPNAQADVIAQALKAAGIDPRDVSYLEAHGTGTSLGDPIEIAGLTKAFRTSTSDNGFCAIGSAKSNIGHCESAAGIAGVTKILLQMKHRQLAPSLHSKVLNPNIEFDTTPFVVQQELTAWERPLIEREGVTREVPRIAGLSSFGAGGSNAHLVIEEYNPTQKAAVAAVTKQNPAVIVLSARNEDRLRERVQQLLSAIEQGHYTEDDLASIAYTLQTGREAMDERLALTVSSLQELEQKLQAFADGDDQTVDEFFYGQVKQHKDTLSVLTSDEEWKSTFDKWIAGRKYSKLLDLWVKGLSIDWTKLYPSEKPTRISLPTYPFEKKRYWAPQPIRLAQTSKSGETAHLHPLVQQNTSDLLEQRYSSTFSGDEFFVAGHVVQGHRLFPAVAYLEMARAAVEQATRNFEDGPVNIALQNTVWAKPLLFGEQPVELHVALFEEDSGEIGYEIYSRAESLEADDVVYSRGHAVLRRSGDASPTVDLQALESACDRDVLTGSQCYETFRQMGIHYGPSQQGLERVRVGDGQALAQLSLPEIVSHSQSDYALHPSLMDAAVQACIGLWMGGDAQSSPTAVTPFALEEVEVLAPMSATMRAWVRYSAGSRSGDRVEKMDLDLCDDQGRVCVRMRGFSLLRQGHSLPASAPVGALLQSPVWEVTKPEHGALRPAATEHVLIVGGSNEHREALQQRYPDADLLDIQPHKTVDELTAHLQTLGQVDHIFWIAPESESAAAASAALTAVLDEQQVGVLSVFRLIKALLALGYGGKELGWTVLTVQALPSHRTESIAPAHSGVHGLVGSAAKEFPTWSFRAVDLEEKAAWPLDELLTLPHDQGDSWLYRSRQWHRQTLRLVETGETGATLYKSGGVYVVIGGAGGIGEVWSEHLIREHQAHVFWFGRRTLDDSIQAKIDRLAALGPAPTYFSADATDADAMRNALAEIKKQHEKIDGVVLSAVGVMDASLANMEEAHFRAGLSAKVDVAVRTAEVLGSEPLDFLLCFSSIGAFGKPLGQASYAVGCTFADAYAQRLSTELPYPVKVMNWGYWGEVGVGRDIPQAFKNRLALSGIGDIEPHEAVQALETLLTGPLQQVALIKSTKPLAFADDSLTVNKPIPSIEMSHLAHEAAEQDVDVEALKVRGEAVREELDALLTELLRGQLQSIDTTQLPALYNIWYQESLAIVGDLQATVDLDSVWSRWEEKKTHWSQDPNLQAQLSLVETTVRALPDILQGKRPATDVMFPNSSMALVEGIYKNNVVADYFNNVLADTLVLYLEERLKLDPSARIRILEIGAGTGGTSARVFEKLKPYHDQIEEYCYSDLSKAFFLHAQQAYGAENPFLTYKIFDVERPLDGQSIQAGTFDIAIAANVLHATKNIRNTMRNIKSALRGNGVVLINELSSNQLFTHLTFGLLEGWWLYEDAELRIAGSPGLYPQTWQSVLEQEGYGTVFFPAGEAHGLGQQIIGAVSDGVVRISRRAETIEVPVAEVKPVQTKNPVRTEPQVRHDRNDRVERNARQDLLREKTIRYFRQLLGETLKIPHQEIDPAEPLESYGIDSILVVQMTNTLQSVFGEVSSTLFFEHQTLNAVVDHFIKTRREALVELFGLDESEPADATEAAHEAKRDTTNAPATPATSSPSVRGGRSRKSRRFLREQPAAAQSSSETVREPIAIIGLSGRYPQARNSKEFWENLQTGRDCITEIPPDRWSLDGFWSDNVQTAAQEGMSYSKWGGFVDGFADFDPLFFNISPREALSMDPQERLFLQASWEVLEDAGYTRERLTTQHKRRVGVFVGITKTGFDLCGSDDWKREEMIFPHTSFGSVANRVSYLLNLSGPSMPIDTMCSSSLTAIHEACEHLYRDECEMAIAGGVNLYLHPSSYIGLSAQQMLSMDGRCKSFGLGGNGFVPGEGVGAVLLKPLSRAVDDGDMIYAVVRSTAINHGGKTNGYTVPNPNAQGELIRTALDKAGLTAQQISYLEAHGTGTELGDPIEITGLTQAFRHDTDANEFCAIGSIKSNIGHLESAAGIAGVTKVILQMKHGMLAPSLHTQELNPNINFARTPFVVQRELGEWKRPVVEVDGQMREVPRIAGISSFGAGGSNAHVLLEEYVAAASAAPITVTKQNPAILVLSAKNEERLKEQVQQLLTCLQSGTFRDDQLASIAYTLQVGREAMEERLAMTVTSVRELTEKLEGVLSGRTGLQDVYRGQVKRNKETMDLFASDDDLQQAVARWIERRKDSKFLELWVKGLALDWNLLYGSLKPQIISLPTYPFARERYWVPEGDLDLKPAAKAQVVATVLHPLLHENTSDFTEQRFTSRFTGREFFLADHVVKGKQVLPGVAYLEMARAAVEKSTHQTGVRLKNVVWARPIVAEQDGVQIHIGLRADENGEIAYEIYSLPEANGGEPIVHGQGTALTDMTVEKPVWDLHALQAQCSSRELAPEQFYDAFRDMGMSYGTGHRGIEKAFAGSEQVLAKLTLPSGLVRDAAPYVLHPSLMDAALQASLGLLLGAGDGEGTNALKPALPFALQELEVYSACTTSMWALIRFSAGSQAGDKVQKLDVDLMDESGRVCVRVKGYASRVLDGDVGAAGNASTSTTLFTPDWKDQAITASTAGAAAEFAERLVILVEPLPSQVLDSGAVVLHSELRGTAQRYEAYAKQLLTQIQRIATGENKGKTLVQLVHRTEMDQQLYAGLFGLLLTAQMEHPRLTAQRIAIESAVSAHELRDLLQANAACPQDVRIRYQNGRRQVAVWNEPEVSGHAIDIPWKDGGTYLITGGAGGLGLLFAEEIARKTQGATLILSSRSPMSRPEKLQNLEALGARVLYKQADVSDENAVHELIAEIRETFGTLNGILHTAGVIRDNFLMKKTPEELRDVLAPKVHGLVHLDEATRDLPLDFLLLFSSLAGATGNAGQGDYAAANGFLDAYATYRNEKAASGERHGRTISINWPLWKNGGMEVSAETEQMMWQNMGMKALTSENGVQALYDCLATGHSQVLAVSGNRARIKQRLVPAVPAKSTVPAVAMIRSTTATAATTAPTAHASTANAPDVVQHALLQTVSKILRVKPEDVDFETELSEYGFDSISFTQFANQLNGEFKLELTPTVFFEYTTLQSLQDFLLAEHREAFISTETPAPLVEAAAASEPMESTESLEPISPRRGSRFAKPVTTSVPQSTPTLTDDEPIAIVGMSGRFPKALDIEEFWRNLAEGRDCIDEIPRDRWDWRAYYGDPTKEANKTNIKWGGFIEGVDQFDPLFFGISPREAELMDPQQRLLMLFVWKVMEEAGISAQSLSGTKTGLFVGTSFSGYSGLISQSKLAVEGYSSTGLVPSVGPNRMSFFLNIHGPSEPIETACSSSLVAIDRAVQAIRTGSCEMAIVGGVNSIVSPEGHISFNKAGMLCEDGRCKTFSDQANGYVRSEGVGMIFLKKLRDAERDGNHIYGLIRGTAVNHGGRANTLTAPNPKAQTELLIDAYTRAGVDPRTVTYIETHGTGTELGDPIEINGLKAAFKELYQATGDSHVAEAHCGLGSVKSNIGHLELASGIAGVIKVLLQLQHKTLVKTLHAETLNPYIQLQNSPFYIVQEAKEWTALQEPNGKKLPRRAGVSSFGFGGANAHVVIEEYVPTTDLHDPQPKVPVTAEHPALIVLSAKNDERLRERAEQLVTTLQRNDHLHDDLAALAYTLQVGRDAMEERLATTVRSTDELIEKLQGFLAGRTDMPDFYCGQVKRNKETTAFLAAHSHWQDAVTPHVKPEEASKLLELWVKGLTLDWTRLYSGTKPRLLSLPTYPFARERYWVSGGDSELPHPLLHQKTSDATQPEFTSIFTGDEFFLKDHVVQGHRILPGVAYLEMARAAVEQVTGKTGARLQNIVWARPIVSGEQGVQVRIGLRPQTDGTVTYEIYSTEDRIVHSQGVASFTPKPDAKVWDVRALQEQCNGKRLTPEAFYETFRSMGMNYGPTHRGIETAYTGSGHVLAKLTLPSEVEQDAHRYVMHPSLLDAALQSSLGLLLGSLDTDEKTSALKPALPFALQELEVFAPCTPTMWAWVRFSEGSRASDNVQKLDIDLMDESGTVCVQLKGYTSRIQSNDGGPSGGGTTTLFQPEWQVQEIDNPSTSEYADRLVFLLEPDVAVGDYVKTHLPDARCMVLQVEQTGIDERYEAYGVQLTEELQRLLQAPLKGRTLIQLVHSDENEKQLFAGLFGLLQTARMENPRLTVQSLTMEPTESGAGLVDKLQANSRAPQDARIRYLHGKRHVSVWTQVEPATDGTEIPWRDHGVYLITGGTGGLGQLFAKEIAQQVQGATLILTGRSPLSENKLADLKQLEALNARVIYRQVDVTDKQSVADLVTYIRETFGELNGILHGAGVLRDNFLLKKSTEELLEVFAPKVRGFVNLDEATRDLPLDFLLLFSSLAGATGNAGQGDYAAANAFLDACAHARNSNGRRTMSINWPLWREGGMSVDAQTEQQMWQTMGLQPLETAAGLRAFYQSFATRSPQVIVFQGSLQRLQTAMDKPAPAESSTPVATREHGSLEQQASHYLKELLAGTIKLPAKRIEADAPLEKYGIDSLMIMQLNTELEKTFGPLSKTLFFEYQTLQELTGYFIENHRDELLGLLGANETPNEPQPEAPSEPPHPRTASGALDIAIIGVSGRYPGARDLGEYWENLKRGRDCITEIPADRWDSNEYFDEDKTKPGKTNSKWGGFLDGVDQFDPLFFNISPREAEIMDPQERLFLQTTYEALEDAGYTRDTLRSRHGNGQGSDVGVFVGVMYQEYQLYGAQETILGKPLALSGSASTIANRVSYFCNFQGPSLAVDTMCSSSLTAIHLAASALLRGECAVAVAGGVNVSIHPNKYLLLGQGKFVSSKGRCESFGEGGDGYVPGEGVGAVLLKPLHQAIADGDQIYGVIKGSALNHGGKTNGYTVPNPNAQAAVIGRALREAGVDPRTISYIEAHGTGTSLGDPIEIAGLTKAFHSKTKDKQFCAIGSVKSNIGHLESAAGIAGLTKVLLQMKHRQLVPSLHSEVLNPNIDFTRTPFTVQQQLADWNRPLVEVGGEIREVPRRAGLSAFGAGGSNVHLVIEEYIAESQPEPQETPTASHLIVLSAKNEARLKEQAQRLLNALRSPLNLHDVAYTLQTGREAMDERLAIVADSLPELQTKLSRFVEQGQPSSDVYRGHSKHKPELLDRFESEEAAQQSAFHLLEQERAGDALELWVNGLNLNWDALYRGRKPRRVSLPTYPFAKERYWVPTMPKREPVVETTITAPSRFGSLLDSLKKKQKSQSFENTSKNKDIYDKIGLDISKVQNKIQSALVIGAAEIIGVRREDIDPHVELEEYGFDPVKLNALVEKINQPFQLDLQAGIFLDHPTLHGLAEHVAATEGERISTYLASEREVCK